jgi:RHS repeat-associated protein
MTVLTGYIYDAGGTRVAKGTITAWSCNPAVNGFKTVSDFVLGLGGEQVTEMGVDTTAGSGTTTLAWQHTNVFAGGKLLGTYDKDGLHFYFDDPLGTRRAQTDYAGHLEQTCQSLPFGDQLACTGGDLQAPTEHHFTGKERDSESGNDYFMARYYSSAMGRFMSPDWSAKAEPVPYARLGDPQSLNLYAYVGNNPLIRYDADGHCWPQFLCNFVSNVGQRFANTWNYGYFKTNSQVDAIAKQGVARLKANGYSPEGLHKSDLLKAANLGLGAKSFQTYLKHHPDLETYSGRTSGTGTPEENVQLRDRNHHMNEKGYGEAELDKSSSNPDAIRGREQMNIEANGGAQSTGGTSGNAINGIADSNPNKGAYMGAAEAEFGAAEGAESTIEVIEVVNDLSDIP